MASIKPAIRIGDLSAVDAGVLVSAALLAGACEDAELVSGASDDAVEASVVTLEASVVTVAADEAGAAAVVAVPSLSLLHAPRMKPSVAPSPSSTRPGR